MNITSSQSINTFLPRTTHAGGDKEAAATFLLDEKGLVSAFDAEAERLFHCRAADVLGQSVTILFRDFPAAILKSAESGPVSRTLRLSARPKDGSVLPVELTLTQICTGSERLWVGALSDSGRRRQVEDGLRRGESEQRGMLDQSPIGLFQMTPEGRYTRANVEAARIYGFDSPENFITQDVSLLAERRAELWACLRNNGGVAEFESQVIRYDGARLWVSENIHPVLNSDGSIRHYVGTIQDISERHSLQILQNERMQEMRTIFDTVGIGIVRVDLTGRLTESNAAFQQMLGYTAAELDGMAFARLTHPDDSPDNVQKEWDLQEGVSDEYRVGKRLCCQDGDTVWTDLSMSLVRDGAGTPQFAIAVVEDITQKHQSQQTILNLNEHLEWRLQRINALRRIDMEIIGSANLNSTMEIILEEVRTHLKVDAAAILLCCPKSQTLEYAAEIGLRHSLTDCPPQTYGFGFAAQAVREKETVQIKNLGWMPDIFAHDPGMKAEGFLTYWAVPLIAKGKVKGVLEVFHRHLLDPDAEWHEFLAVLAGQAAIAIDSATMFQDLECSNRELREAYEATIEGWGHALDLRDQETEGHSRRVTDLVDRLAEKMGVSKAQRVHIRRGALLHDIGKMGVPDRILLKTDNLTPTEWRLMRRHPQDAYNMLSSITFLRPALDIPLCHHEKWDGTGYPQGLRGEEIPLAARLFSVVDIWDALRSDRPYRGSWPEDQVLTYLQGLAGSHLEPEIVTAFLDMMSSKSRLIGTPLPDTDLLLVPLAA